MPDIFRGWMIDSHHKNTDARLQMAELTEDDLPEGDVTINVSYSCINYKDAAAIAGTTKILRVDKCIPGIDLAGKVSKSESPDFKEGDDVFVTGFGLGEERHGGMAERARVPAKFVSRMPPGMDARKVMTYGTAGFTAGLSVRALRKYGHIEKGADVLVTSVGGGVGSISAALVSEKGYDLHAVTRREREDYALSFKPKSVIFREDFIENIRVLDEQRFDAGIDTAGGKVLSKLLTQVRDEGAVVCCGVTAGAQVETTVMPFILRGIMLKGINSVHVPHEIRNEVWESLSESQGALEKVDVREVALNDISEAAMDLIKGNVRGRIVVRVRGD